MIPKQEKIYNELGKQLVNCNFNCSGINNNKKFGYFPRLLFIEKGNDNGKGAIIIGLNPGKCGESERKWVSKNQDYWVNQKDYYSNNLLKWKYFRRVKELLNLLGYQGDILWTNLVKCECIGSNGDLPIQTIRTCVNKFLKNEIDSLLPQCDIFAIGNQSFGISSVAFPNNFVIGLPHSSGPYASTKFLRLLEKIRKDKKKYLNIINKKGDNNNQILAIKL
ncbi:MAG: hypothetical protein WCT16_01405 [Candidatus Buchananbacteria bacterium]